MTLPDKESWASPTLVWMMTLGLGSALLWGGYYWGQGASQQVTQNTRMDKIEQHTVELSNADRAYFDHELLNLSQKEGNDVAELKHTAESDRATIADIQRTVNAIHDQVVDIAATVKYNKGPGRRAESLGGP